MTGQDLGANVFWANRRVYGLLAGAAAVWVAVSGCQDAPGPKTAPVKGKVTYQGKPFTQGVVLLFPEGNGHAATGTLEAEGTFRLTTFKKDDGAVPGKYKVAVQAAAAEGAVPGMEFAGRKPPIPPRYMDANTSGLTAEINPGANVLDIQLKD